VSQEGGDRKKGGSGGWYGSPASPILGSTRNIQAGDESQNRDTGETAKRGGGWQQKGGEGCTTPERPCQISLVEGKKKRMYPSGGRDTCKRGEGKNGQGQFKRTPGGEGASEKFGGPKRRGK